MLKPRQIINLASAFFDKPAEEITSSNRKGEYVKIRQFIMALSNIFLSSDDEVAAALGIDRTTVVTGRQRWKFLYDNDARYRDEFNEFREFASPTTLEQKRSVRFPNLLDYNDMTTDEIISWKIKASDLANYLTRIVRKRIQR